MPITFTGLEAQASVALLSHVTPGSKVRHVHAHDVMNSPRMVRLSKVVWLYRAPWSLVGQQSLGSESVAHALSQWLDVHRALLRKRRTVGKELLLVNVDAFDPSALLSSLELPFTGNAASTAEPNESVENDPEVTALLAQVFELVAPEYADVFHALEALSWHGQESHAGQAQSALTDEAVLQMFQMLADSQAVPGLKAMLSAAQTEAHRHAALVADLELALAKSQAAERAAIDRAVTAEQFAAQETKRLQAELVQAKQQVPTMQAQKAAAEQRAREQAEFDKLKAELAQAKQQVSTAQAQAQKAVASQRAREQAEFDKLKAELAQAKQQVSTAQAQAQKIAVDQRAREQAELDKLKVELAQAKQQLSTVQAQAQKAAADQRAREQAELEELKAQTKEMQSENDLLLVEMHQVQEDLERYFLENRQLQQVIVESHGSLDRARKVISNFIKGAAIAPSPVPVAVSD